MFECVITAEHNGKSEKAYNNWFLKSLPNGYFIGDALAKMITAQMHILFDRGPSFPHSFAKFNQTFDKEGILGRVEAFVPRAIAHIDPVSYVFFGTKFKVVFKKIEVAVEV